MLNEKKHDLCAIRIAMTWQNKHVACVAPHSRLSAQEVLKSNTLALQHHGQALGRLTILKCVTALSDHLWNLAGFCSGVITALIAAVL